MFHWILIIVDLDKSTVHILDSKKGPHEEYQEVLDLLDE